MFRAVFLTILKVTIGSRLGPYEILAPLGAGGMGEVYRARDPRIGRDVAMKLLLPIFSSDPDQLRRFEQESRAAGMLNHPNLLAVFDVGTENGAPYIVSELLDGETLRSKLNSGPIPLRKAIEYTRQIAAGLAAAHEKGIVHRDLKPENIFVTKDGQVKILDFGLAKLSNRMKESSITDSATLERRTDPGTILGTVGYMSPEQVRAQPVDHRSDIFSLGSILYEMLTGRPAFRGVSKAETMSAILREDPPEISSSNANTPPALERIVRHCLEKDAEQRFQSARDLAFDLDALSGSGGVAALAATRAGRRYGRLAVIPLATLLAGVAIGMLIMRWTQKPPAGPPILRLLTYSGRDVSPSVSPDRRTIAFSSTRDGRSRIWLKDLTTGGEIPLTEGEDSTPRFSWDGTSVLFIRKEGARQVLWRTPVLGGSPRRLLPDVISADWSIDGRRIAFVRWGGTSSSPQTILGTIAADGSGETLLRTIPGQYGFPRPSPGGQWIALTEFVPGNNNARLLLVSADGKSTRELFPMQHTAVLSGTSWIDDNHLLYAMSQSATGFTNLGSEIVLADTEKRTSTPLVQTLETVMTLDVAGENRLVFDSVHLRQNLRELQLSGAGVGRWLTRGHAVADRQPAYSADGTRIAFSSNRSGNLDLWTVSTTDGSLTRITDDVADDYDPSFTRDGKHLIWSSNRSGHFEIWMADVDGSGAHQVTHDGNDAENATATPDGQWIVYNSYNPQKLGVWKVRSDGSAPTQLVQGSMELPEVSPDGQYASFHRVAPPSDLNVVRLSDGKVFHVAEMRGATIQTSLTAGDPWRSAGRSRWTADGKSIAWIDLDEKGNWAVLLQRFTPGVDTSATRRKLAGLDPDTHVESFGFSPDGRSVTVSVLEEIDAVYSADGVAGIQRPRR